MLARDGDRMIASFVHPVELGDTFIEWPLHVTIVSWFRTPFSTPRLAELLRVQYQGLTPFTATVGPEAHFGLLGATLVNLILLPNQFTELFTRTMGLIHQHGIQMVAPPHDPYHPHVTVHKHGRTQEGQGIACDRLYIIRYHHQSAKQYKQIEAEVRLG